MNVNEWIASKRKRAKPVRTWNGSTQAPIIRNGKLVLASADDAPSEQAQPQAEPVKRTSKSGPTAEAAEELRRLWAEDDKRGGPMF